MREVRDLVDVLGEDGGGQTVVVVVGALGDLYYNLTKNLAKSLGAVKLLRIQ